MMRTTVAAMLVVGLVVSAQAEPHALSPADMRAIGTDALNAGQPTLAFDTADALLTRDPEDMSALILRAHSARMLGRFDVARAAAAEAWRLAETDEQKFTAALTRAQVLSSSGNRTMAQVWLRRATQVAPTENHRAIAVRDYKYVRHKNPLKLDFSFSIAPNSNINNGSTSDTGTFELPFFGEVEAQLQGAAQALSGTEMRTGVGVRYRLKDRGAQGYTDLRLRGSRSDFRLSDEAKRKAPTADASDFAFASTTVALEQVGLAPFGRAQYALSGAVGRTWYGGDPYTQSADVVARLAFPMAEGRAVGVSVGAQKQEALSTRTADANSWNLGVDWQTRVGEAGHKLGFALGTERSFSDAAFLDWRNTEARAQLAMAEPVLGADLAFGVSMGQRSYDRGPVSGEGRQDRTVGASITVEPEALDLYGFVPTVTLSARRTDSDYGQYDREEIGLSLGFSSAF